MIKQILRNHNLQSLHKQNVAQQPATQPAPVQPAVAPAPVKEPVKTVQPAVEKHTATVEHKAEPRREQTSVVQRKNNLNL